MNIQPDKSGSGFCPICGDFLTKKFASHFLRCKNLPSAREIKQMLDDDPDLAISTLALRLGIHINRLTNIILRGKVGLTKEYLRERGIAIRARKNTKTDRADPIDYVKGRFECAGGCGLMVKNQGYYCKFCVMEKNGIKNLNDLRFGDHSPELMVVVASDVTTCYRELEIT